MSKVAVGKSQLFYRKAYLNPLLNLDQLVKSTRHALKLRIARWRRVGRSAESALIHVGRPKTYEPPRARAVTLSQARLLALGSVGLDDHENAFMQLLFDGCNRVHSEPSTSD